MTVVITDDNYLDIVTTLIKDERKVRKGVNLQNIPTRSKNGKRVRNAFIPPKDWIFVGSDLGQIEPRIQAHIMYTVYEDNSMRSIFLAGVDLYTTMAMRVFGFEEKYCVDKAEDPKGKFQPRDVIKTGILAKSYGQSAEAFARNVGIPLAEATKFFEGFDEQFPSFTRMVSDSIDRMKEQGFVETLYGRKIRFPDYKKVAAEVNRNEQQLLWYYVERKQLNANKKTNVERERLIELEELIEPLASKRNLISYWERAAFNGIIQGTGADVLKRIGNRMARECINHGWEMPASIHDEIKIAVPKVELTTKVIELVQTVMTTTSEFSVPLVTDTVIEPRWAEEYDPSEWDFDKQMPKAK